MPDNGKEHKIVNDELPQDFLILGDRFVSIEPYRTVEATYKCGTLYVVGHPIFKNTPWHGGVTKCSYEELLQSICNPREDKYSLSEEEQKDNVNYKNCVRVFTDLKEARTRCESYCFGELDLMRSGIPIIRIKVFRKKLAEWQKVAIPIVTSDTGFSMPLLKHEDFEMTSAEFVGSLFSPYLPSCVIL